MVTTNKHSPFSGYFVFDDSHETVLHMQDSCNYVTLKQYAKINVNQNSLAFINLNCGSLRNNINDIEMFLMKLNKKPDICLFTETWLSHRLVPPRIEGFIDFFQYRPADTKSFYFISVCYFIMANNFIVFQT